MWKQQGRPSSLGGAQAIDDWAALSALHARAPHSGALPDMPTSIAFTSPANGTSPGMELHRDFTGTPMLLKPILKRLIRLERPLITWDLFEDAPPKEFPLQPSGAPMEDGNQTDAAADVSEKPLRDPRVVNRVVHEGYKRGVFNRANADLNDEDWLDNAPDRIEDEHWTGKTKPGGLYVLRCATPDGEFFLGLGRDLGAHEGERMVQWYGRASKAHRWGASVKFDQANWDVKEAQPHDSFLLAVDEDTGSGDVTNSSTKKAPFLNAAFMSRLRAFAGRHGLLNVQKSSGAKKTKGAEPAEKADSGTAKRKQVQKKGRRAGRKG